jgi:molybdopterin converting factor small subunit
VSVRVMNSSLLRKSIGEQKFVEVPAGSPLECLQKLADQFPEMRFWIYDKNGEVRPQLWLFVNGQRIYAKELNQRLNDGDELHLLLALSGG